MEYRGCKKISNFARKFNNLHTAANRYEINKERYIRCKYKTI